MDILNWDLLRYFHLVANHGSVSQAARASSVSHATVLRAINKLEDQLGSRIFDHIQSGYRLTPQGEELLIHVDSIAEEVASLERRARAQGKQPSGELRMVLPDSGITDLLSSIRAFQANYPDVTIASVDLANVSESTFMSEDIQIAFILTNSPPESLVGRQVAKINLVPYCPNGNDENWIIWGKTTEVLDAQRQAILRYGQGSVSMTMSNHEQALEAVTKGSGAALLSDKLAIGGRQESKIQVSLGLWVLTHPDLRRDISVISLMRHLSERINPSSLPESRSAVS